VAWAANERRLLLVACAVLLGSLVFGASDGYADIRRAADFDNRARQPGTVTDARVLEYLLSRSPRLTVGYQVAGQPRRATIPCRLKVSCAEAGASVKVKIDPQDAAEPLLMASEPSRAERVRAWTELSVSLILAAASLAGIAVLYRRWRRS
jgi:hypothetical protein